MFLIFGAAFGGLDILGDYGVGVILTLLGLFIIGRGLVGSRRNRSEE
jgi:vacuolar-type H+-ATPase subunit I/STV1